MKSFALLRTNVGLTTNVKIMVGHYSLVILKELMKQGAKLHEVKSGYVFEEYGPVYANVAKTCLKKKVEAKKLLPSAYSVIDKAAKRGVIKKNTASRKKARLSKITK